VIVEDILTDPRWDGLRELAVTHHLRACWSEPVFSAAGQVVGTFAMYYRRPRAPAEAELSVIETAAHLVGIAIEHKRAQEALRLANQTLEHHVEERTKELATLNAIAAMVSRSLDLEEVLSAALDKTMEVIGTEAGAAYRLEGATQELILMAQRGLSDDLVRSTTHLALEVALAGQTVNTSQPLIWDIARDYPASELKQQIQCEGLQLVVGVPLLAKDRLVGSLVLSSRAMRTLTPEESSMLMAIGQQVGVAVENARLFEEHTRRVNNLSQLYQANLTLSASVELDEVLRYVSQVAREISEADAVSLHIYDEATDSFTQAHALGVTGDWSPTHVRRAGMTRRVIHEGTPILVDDTLDNPEVNPHTIEAGLRSLIATPLVSQGKPVGVIYVGSFSPHRFDADDVQWVSALANQAAVAIANARLYEAERARHAEAERRRQVAEGLREILAVLNSRQSLEETLDFIVSQACRLMRCDAASILQLQSDGWLKIRSACGLDADYVANMRMPLGGGGAGRALAGHQPVTLSDARVFAAALARESDAAASQELTTIERTMSRGYYALLSVPLIIKDEDYGAITLYYREAREFSEEESRLASSVAHQAALAIESARLREQAEQSAAMAERSRLARELHDSVTQSLYSIMLYAEAGARALAEGDKAPAVEYLQELRATAQEALREMRLLIFELRPLALEKSGLVAALRARLEAVEARSGMQADFRVEGADAVACLSFTLQDELYHIVHEALNNVLKHSNAKHVQVDLQIQDTNVHLEICDDGVGFICTSNGTAGGLGLSSMRERSQRLGGQLQIESSPGHGASVLIDVPINPAHLSDTVFHSL
jgi:GAF domain-containing protein